MSDSKNKDDRTQLTLRLPKEIYEALKEEAERVRRQNNRCSLLPWNHKERSNNTNPLGIHKRKGKA